MAIGSCSYGPGPRCWQNIGQYTANHGEILVKSIISALAVTLAGGLLLTLAGCTESGDAPATENPALATPVPAGSVRGEVLETMDSGGYTYVLIESDPEPLWAAGPYLKMYCSIPCMTSRLRQMRRRLS